MALDAIGPPRPPAEATTAGAIMGIYDREYYRDKTRGSGWLSGSAPACKAIILINVAVLIAQKISTGSFDTWLVADSDAIFRGQIWRLLTGPFVHNQDMIWPFAINMLILWMFGQEMESFYATRDFLAMYLSAAVVSTLAWAFVDHFGRGHAGPTPIGSSGAVFAVSVLYAMYYPRREILVMFVFPVEVWLILTFYIGWDLIQFLGSGDDRMGYSAHLAGAGFGYLYKAGDLRLSRLEKLVFHRSPRLRIVAPEPREAPPSPRPSAGPTWSPNPAAATRPSAAAVLNESDEQFEERFDQILQKIAREGRGALTEDENRVLDEASRRARQRRSDRI